MTNNRRLVFLSILKLVVFLLTMQSHITLSSPRIDTTRYQNRTWDPPVEAASLIEECGRGGQYIYVWEGKSVKRNEYQKKQYIYSPCMLFQKDPSATHAKIEVMKFEDDPYSVVYMWLVADEKEIKEKLVSRISDYEKQPLSEFNLQPIGMFLIDMYLYDENCFPFNLGWSLPEKTDLDANQIRLAREQLIEFKVPTIYLDEFVSYLKKGITFKIRYMYPGQKVEKSFIDANTEIKINSELLRDLLGGRTDMGGSVLASKTQMMDFFTQVAIDNRVKIKMDDKSLYPFFLKKCEDFLSYVEEKAARLGDLSEGIISTYKIKEDDLFMTPNYKTMSEQESEEYTMKHEVMKDFLKTYKKILEDKNIDIYGHMKGEVDILKLINVKPDLQGHYIKKTIEEMIDAYEHNQEFDETYEHLVKWKDYWEGMQIEPLDLKIYNISKTDLEMKIKTLIEVESYSDEAGLNIVTMVRNTKYDTIESSVYNSSSATGVADPGSKDLFINRYAITWKRK
ncbi:MAG: hypothetical protein ABIA04_05900 [Pseudomonadota bacterium]